MNYSFKQMLMVIPLIIAPYTLLYTAEETKNSINADEIASYVQLYPALEEGLAIVREYDTTIPTLATIFTTHLQSQPAHDHECNFIDIFDAARESAENLIAQKIQPQFMQIINDSIESKNNAIHTNSLCTYLAKHHAGWMARITENWKHEEFELLCQAIINNSAPTVKTLLALTINKNSMHEKVYTPLHLAAQHNRIAITKILLKHNFNGDIQDYAGQTPLLIAATFKHPKVMSLLLQAGANPNLMSDDKETALTECISTNNIAGVKHLLKADADLSIQYGYGYTALHIATLQNKPKIIKLLLQAGADVNALCQHNNTALNFAIQYNNPEMIQLFLDADADLTLRSRQGLTPLFLAKNTCLEPIISAAIEKKRKAEADESERNKPNKLQRL